MKVYAESPEPSEPGACGGDTQGDTQGDTGACGVAGCGHDGRDPREHGTRFLDAFVEGCRRPPIRLDPEQKPIRRRRPRE